MVKGLPPDMTGFDLTDAYPPPVKVNFLHFVQGARVDVLLLTKRLRCTSDQRFHVVDNLADVVRNASGRVGGVRAALEGDDLQFWSAPTRLRCRAHTRRVAANDNKPLAGHRVSPFMKGHRLSRVFYM
jgi:hypothetical protein